MIDSRHPRSSFVLGPLGIPRGDGGGQALAPVRVAALVIDGAAVRSAVGDRFAAGSLASLPSSGRLPTPAVVVRAGDPLTVSGHPAHAVVRQRTELVRLDRGGPS